MRIDSMMRISFVLVQSQGNITPPHKLRNGSTFVIRRLSEHKMHCPFGALNGVLANRKRGEKGKETHTSAFQVQDIPSASGN